MRTKKATIVVDLGFGDAGKGTMVDYLARQEDAPVVVRFNGGGQAAHNVHTADGRHHTFAQFGSGTFTPQARTHLSRFMLLDPESMETEAEHLAQVGCGNVFARLTVDEDAKVVTPFHKAANRLRETLRGAGRHGTCGMGIGETVSDDLIDPLRTIVARDLRDRDTLLRKLALVQEVKRAEFGGLVGPLTDPALLPHLSMFTDTSLPRRVAEHMWRVAMRFRIVSGTYLRTLAQEHPLIFEGAQGVLLDQWYGFHPHTTWSVTTFQNARTLLQEIAYDGEVEKLGVLRAYHTRHGEGPLPTFDTALTKLLPETTNSNTGWQGDFRCGWFDLVLARYALSACGGADSLAITHLDRVRKLPQVKWCDAYQVEGRSEWVHTLPLKPELTDQSFQAKLTELLNSVTGCVLSSAYTNFFDVFDEEAFLQTIERGLGLPVRMVSDGPTAQDKHVRLAARMAA